jgi:polyribonucleotide nucleotidyltransferase
MFNIVKKEMEWGGRTLTLETGRIARQADGAVLATYGETVVLCTVVAAKSAKPDIDFFPLTVMYQERTYAAGKIPGGFIKREGKPSEKDTLTSRLIDRPLRPLFPDTFRNETQIICTVISHDLENDPDIVAMVGSSAALAISGIPFDGPIGAARAGYKDGEFILNPTYEQLEYSELELVAAGKNDGVMMVESEAKELSEETMLGAVMFCHEKYQPVINLIQDFAKEAGKEAWAVPEEDPRLLNALKALTEKFEGDLRKAYGETDKKKRHNLIGQVRTAAHEALVSADQNTEAAIVPQIVDTAFKKLEKKIVRGDILKTGKRIDGRDTKTVRPITCEVGILPRVHGSALFTRGETQAIVVTTLGTGQDEQIVDRLEGEIRRNFMLDYNFPPYSVGEAGRMGPPGRREIGHGKLAWRAINPLIPSKDVFPYTLRVVSEITESNGSSSMATVCGTSLSLMDAGVPLPKSVAGIAMGLIKEKDEFSVLSDILGDEDHLGDMDFKVAGTGDGVTSLQMDIKVSGITEEIMKTALGQAQEGRMHILGEMSHALTGAREGISTNAPRMVKVKIPKDKIGELIGPGGSNIREICEETGAKIDIAEDGTVTISSSDLGKMDQAVQRVESVAAEPEMDAIYRGKVAKVVDFGAFVDFLGKRSGLVHISQIVDRRIETVSEVLNEGDEVYVQVIGFDNRGKIKLSMKTVDQESGQALTTTE